MNGGNQSWVQDTFLLYIHGTDNAGGYIREKQDDSHGDGEPRAMCGIAEDVVAGKPPDSRHAPRYEPAENPFTYRGDPVAEDGHGKGGGDPFERGD